MVLVWKSGLNFVNLDNQRILQQLSDLIKLYSKLERYNELFEINLDGEIGFKSQDVDGKLSIFISQLQSVSSQVQYSGIISILILFFEPIYK